MEMRPLQSTKKVSPRQLRRQRKEQRHPGMSREDLQHALGMSPKQRLLNLRILALSNQLLARLRQQIPL